MIRSAAEILREYGPFPGVDQVNGVTFDGRHVWFATGDKLTALDPASGTTVRAIDVAAHAGTAFDGQHLFQLAEDRIQKVDPNTGRVLATIPAPGGGADSGLAWAEGTLWVGQYRDRKIHQIDPQTGAILRTIECSRFVTGVTWVDGELWHATWDNDESDVRRIDPHTGAVLEGLDMPAPACRGSSPMAPIGSSAAADAAARCAPSAGRGEAPRRADAPRLRPTPRASQRSAADFIVACPARFDRTAPVRRESVAAGNRSR
jgi:outer membrane protein assembly factor BamB